MTAYFLRTQEGRLRAPPGRRPRATRPAAVLTAGSRACPTWTWARWHCCSFRSRLRGRQGPLRPAGRSPGSRVGTCVSQHIGAPHTRKASLTSVPTSRSHGAQGHPTAPASAHTGPAGAHSRGTGRRATQDSTRCPPGPGPGPHLEAGQGCPRPPSLELATGAGPRPLVASAASGCSTLCSVLARSSPWCVQGRTGPGPQSPRAAR
jgi:hypothetical protein